MKFCFVIFLFYIPRVRPTRCDASQFIYFCKTLCMFQTCFPAIIKSKKLHIQRQAFVRPLLQERSDKYLTLYVQFCALDDGRKTRLKHAERLTEINKLRSVASCWLYSDNILAMHGPMNVKFCFILLIRNGKIKWQRFFLLFLIRVSRNNYILHNF